MSEPDSAPPTAAPQLPPDLALKRWMAYAQHAYGEHLPLRAPLFSASPPRAPVSADGGKAPAAARQAAPAPAPAPPSSGVGAPDPAPAAREHDPAAAPSEGRSLEEIAAAVAGCTACKLCTQRTHTVPGEGAPNAEVMFVGEAPGAREDATGRPFVGPAGELLDRIIQYAMGLQRSDTFIANLNKCRPPGNRNPEPDEVAACLPFLHEQIHAIRPRVLVTLGRVAAANLLGRDEPLARLRGQSLELDGIPVVATWHPAYLLRNPAAKKDTWEDIKRVNRLLGRPEDPRQN